MNRQIRVVLDEHRGMRLDRMAKAAFWHCNSRLEVPATPERALAEFPTDETIADLYRAAGRARERDELVERWDIAVGWTDLHSSGQWRNDLD